MTKQILQINFTFKLSRGAYEQLAQQLAQPIADVDGLIWKVWPMNEVDSEAGGFYLFENAESVQAFLEGPIVAQVVAHPDIVDINVKQFEVLDELSAITRGPLTTGVKA